MTSNLGSDQIAEYGREELLKEDRVRVSQHFKDKVIRPIIKEHFKRDEFLGRINEIVYFVPFSRTELTKLVDKELKDWSDIAKERHKISLSWDNTLIEVLVRHYKIHYGARSIKHAVERYVINKIAFAHTNRLINPGISLHITVEEDLKPKSDDRHFEPKIKLQLKVKKELKTVFIDLPID